MSFLNRTISFRTRISQGVYWVPVSVLGETRYSDKEILQDVLSLSPLNRKESINCLYEAVQLFQIGNFEIEDDNYYVKLHNKIWECHLKGEVALKRNRGCCSSAASWLCYLLDARYEKIGVFSMSSETGNGHVLNYILHDKKIFFLIFMPWQINLQHKLVVKRVNYVILGRLKFQLLRYLKRKVLKHLRIFVRGFFLFEAENIYFLYIRIIIVNQYPLKKMKKKYLSNLKKRVE